MKHSSKFRGDDENDTLTFERWQEYVVEHYPNPDRIGCPDHEVLREFVESPAEIGLDKLNDTHITRCRECTLELQRLRREREDRLAQPRAPIKFGRRSWISVATVLAAGVVVVVAIVFWKSHSPRSITATDEVGHVEIDLSGDGVLRGVVPPPSAVQVSLPRRIIDLHLMLPYLSPAGTYRITVQRDQSSQALIDSKATAQVNGIHAALRVRFDLRTLPSGHYLLGTRHNGETTYFYPLTVK